MADPSEQSNVVRGHKAAIHNPNVSEEAKEHSRTVLESLGEPTGSGTETRTAAGGDEQKDPGNVARGLKASISNAGVSDEAKEAAKKKLDQLS